MNNKDVLVSIVVVSYNAEKTILETLDSIKNQTYQYIELIITDDCSTDRTVSVCKEWLEVNQERFKRAILLESIYNEGVVINGNKGFAEAKGEWIKGIGSDDALLPDCISNYMDFVMFHPEAVWVTSCIKEYKEYLDEDYCINEKKGPKDLLIFEKPIEIQLKAMAYDEFLYAQTLFIKSSAFREVGGFDINYAYEDWPLFISLLEQGYKCYYMDSVTMQYRVHTSISHTNNKLFNYSLTLKSKKIIREKCFKYYTHRKILATKFRWGVERIMVILHLDRDNAVNRFIYNKFVNFIWRLGKPFNELK